MNLDRGKSLRKSFLICVMIGTASIFTGCGFRQYERVEQTGGVGIEMTSSADRILGENSDNKDSEIEIQIDQAGTQTEDVQDGIRIENETVMETEEESGADSVTMLFAGDIYLSEYVLDAYQRAGGISGVLDAGYRREIQNADLFFANEEFAFSDRGEPTADKQYTFRLPVERAAIFQEMRIDGVTLANNHALDYGRTALLDTCETLDQAGIQHTGAGENLEAAMQPAVFTVSGAKIAVIGATRVIPQADWAAGPSWTGMLSAYDPSTLISQIRALSQSGEYQAVIAYLHWGIERDEIPQDYQRTMAKQLIDAGADLVIGAHPHVLQGIEYYQGKPIVYSLGNFVFGSSISRTALLKVTWAGEASPVLTLLPGTSASGYTQMLTDESKRNEFFQYMEGISDGICLESDGTVKSLE
ncbi:MAG: CapA family protein [Clostridiales bacterium]|nr:CapA family protein [Clostridiales bacterium]